MYNITSIVRFNQTCKTMDASFIKLDANSRNFRTFIYSLSLSSSPFVFISKIIGWKASINFAIVYSSLIGRSVFIALCCPFRFLINANPMIDNEASDTRDLESDVRRFETNSDNILISINEFAN